MYGAGYNYRDHVYSKIDYKNVNLHYYIQLGLNYIIYQSSAHFT